MGTEARASRARLLAEASGLVTGESTKTVGKLLAMEATQGRAETDLCGKLDTRHFHGSLHIKHPWTRDSVMPTILLRVVSILLSQVREPLSHGKLRNWEEAGVPRRVLRTWELLAPLTASRSLSPLMSSQGTQLRQQKVA